MQPSSKSVSVDFETDPARYQHWRLEVSGPVATLVMDVREDGGLSDDYRLKLNSYDLAVDIELADAIARIRFEHPAVRVVVLRSGKERIFCAGANIFMLAGASHAHKVNFCKFTNETRLAMEDASAHSGVKFLCAINGVCAGGGYELALACDEILLVDDGNAAVSLPETPLLGVLPGTGGLTRLVDKRRVRRDLADLFCTLVEGVKGRRAVEWRLVDAVAPTSRFSQAIDTRVQALAARSERPAGGRPCPLDRLDPVVTDARVGVPARVGGPGPRETHGPDHGPRARRASARDGRRDRGGGRRLLAAASVPRARRCHPAPSRQRARAGYAADQDGRRRGDGPRRGRRARVAPRPLAGARNHRADAPHAEAARPDGTQPDRHRRARLRVRGIAVRTGPGRRSHLHARRSRSRQRDRRCHR